LAHHRRVFALDLAGATGDFRTVGGGFAWSIRLHGESPQLFLAGWYADYPDPDTFLRTNPFLGFTGWKEPQFERLVEEAHQARNQEKRINLYQQAENILLKSAVIMPLLYGREHWLVKPWVKKLPVSPIKWWFWKDVMLGPH
jgi:ABC-type oligopeptide transport system substrate-binding subunit